MRVPGAMSSSGGEAVVLGKVGSSASPTTTTSTFHHQHVPTTSCAGDRGGVHRRSRRHARVTVEALTAARVRRR